MECGDQDESESTGALLYYQVPDGRVRVATGQRQPRTRVAWYWQLPEPGVREPDHFLLHHFPPCLARPSFAPTPSDLVVQVAAPGLGHEGSHISNLGHTTYVGVHLAVLAECGDGALLHLYDRLGPPNSIVCRGSWQVVRTVRQPELSFSAFCSLMEWVYSSSRTACENWEAKHCCICCVPDLLSVRLLATGPVPELRSLANLLAVAPLDSVAAVGLPGFHGFELSPQQAAMMSTFFFEALDVPLRDSAGGLAFMRPGLHVVWRGPLLVADVAGHVVPRLRPPGEAVVPAGRHRYQGCYALLIPAARDLAVLLDYLQWCRILTVRGRVAASQLGRADGNSIVGAPRRSEWVRLCLRVPDTRFMDVLVRLPSRVETLCSRSSGTYHFMSEDYVGSMLQTLRQLHRVDMHLRGYLAFPLQLRTLDVLFSRVRISFAFVNFASNYSVVVEGDLPLLIEILHSFQLSLFNDSVPNHSTLTLADPRTAIRLVEIAMDDYPTDS